MAVSATSVAKNRIRVFKIVVLGDGGVGKSGTLLNAKADNNVN
jgi:GTPase SAR1 family protein